ncbi:hypothetical protein Poli38472_003252 [Pythium oligandrum]|uniref:Uncharacterized protein n=1 Tax=Pythium oligandrum TaxID=41045 RepID=A0A8K1C794_PYTOL|nr:hypothetical protein Poli38472_003252 [Pythium oligandrum]|eukprot:TMW57327.1 hypothetical protein Poli38472_003252 [Pythium oligandrum]
MASNEALAGAKCYVPDDKHVWLPARILREERGGADKKYHVRVFTPEVDADGVETGQMSEHERVIDFNDKATKSLFSNLQLDALPYQNDNVGSTGMEDMIALNYLHEPAILFNVKKRFLDALPYTYTGDICIAVNPYQWLPALYTEELHTQYMQKPRDELPPHVYATSVASYNDMKRFDRNQSILVSGESGAGKTETTKILMNHLASVAGGLNDSTIKKIIQVNPLLESFGNAKTVRNDNSSRFGKFTQLQFDTAGILVGAKCRTYLLEKTRVIHHEAPERNYHIFYQLLDSSDDNPEWRLQRRKMYSYTGENQQIKIEGMSDAQHFERTKAALTLIGLGIDEQTVLFEVIAGILHLGEVQIQSKPNNDEESVLAPNDPGTGAATTLLGVTTEQLETALCSRKITVSNEILTAFLKKAQAEECRDALSKAIYAKLFDWLVVRINASLANDSRMNHHVGILDIFGFEHFKHNSFEQFCINYANEKLQQKFTQDVFKTVQIEYEAEGIAWSHIDFADNQDVISIIEDRLGIISLLNDEVMRPKGSDESLVSKLTSIRKDDKHVIEFARTSRTQFTIKHYAGSVTYEAQGFLEKHKDALLPDLSDLMRASSKGFLRDLFKEESAAVPTAAAASRGRGRGGGGALSVANVGTQFKDNLNELMVNIRETKVHYVRCIKPNQVKSAKILDHSMVVSQLRCAGVIEAIRISRVAYPNRLSLEELISKFWIFAPQKKKAKGEEESQAALSARCETIMAKMEFKMPEDYQVGRTRVYFRFGILEAMEEKKAVRLDTQARRLQHIMKGFACRLLYLRKCAAIIKLQSVARCVIWMARYHAYLKAITTLQAHWRGQRDRRIAAAVKRHKKAIVIQRHVRGFIQRRQFLRKRSGVVKVQALMRMKNEHKKFVKALQDKKMQDDMTYQLQQLQERLQEEQRRNEERGSERDSFASRPSMPSQDAPMRTRAKSSAHMWMQDADGIMNQLHEEINRLRKENADQRMMGASMRNEIEKLRNEKELAGANFHVKIRQLEDVIRDKDKKIAIIERECSKLRDQVSGGSHNDSNDKSNGKERRSIFRTLGSKKDVTRNTSVFDSFRGSNDDVNRSSVAVQSSLAQKSADTAQFLRESAQRMSLVKFWGSPPDRDSELDRLSDGIGSEGSGRLSMLSGGGGVSGAMSTLKGRMAAVKGKYYGESSGSSSTSTAASDSFRSTFTGTSALIPALPDSINLDTMPDTPLPSGWEARLSRSKNKVYYCNPSLRLTQWDRPTIETLKARKLATVAANKAKKDSGTLSPPSDGVLHQEGQI